MVFAPRAVALATMVSIMASSMPRFEYTVLISHRRRCRVSFLFALR